jgi:hypothetical protein
MERFASETVHSITFLIALLQNCNSTPIQKLVLKVPKEKDYLPYMAPDGESFRGVNAVRLLSKGEKYTLDKVLLMDMIMKLHF